MTGGMMFKGTPGPWSIEPDRDHPDTVWHVVGESTVVCGLDGIASHHRSNDITFDEDKANMVLIAAAPELLEIAAMVDAWGNGLRHHTAHEAKMVKSARTVIAKALGEQK